MVILEARNNSFLVENQTTVKYYCNATNLAANQLTFNNMNLIPNWVVGSKVKLSSTGTLPPPLNSTTEYYFIPTDLTGIFNLSNKRYPKDITELIDIQNVNVGLIGIQRIEPIYPGAVVTVTDSYLSRNNGTYYVDQVIPEGLNFRITTLQSTASNTLPGLLTDGVMVLDALIGYDVPAHCYLLHHAGGLYTSAFVDEKITFEFELVLNDMIPSAFTENNTEFQLNSIISPSYNVLPMGLDTQYFDIGLFDEDLPKFP
jgi:hypothetical protein